MNRLRFAALLSLAALSIATPSTGTAQAWAYPAFQPPRIVTREYNFGIADADNGGASIVFQWREQAGPQSLFSFDLGIADTDGRDDDLVLFGGVGLGYRLGAATSEVPLDFMLTAGAYLALGEVTLFRLPIGVSMGHRFNLGDGMSLTPFLHPRLSIDMCSDCSDNSDIALSFDLGANFQITRSVSIRGAAVFSGSDYFDEGFGISIAWTPPSLARRR